MNHSQILKRSWEILWCYKTLWIFGILIALSTGRGASFNLWNVSPTKTGQFPSYTAPLPSELQQEYMRLVEVIQAGLESGLVQSILVAVTLICCLGILIAIGLTILSYVSQTALIRMVDQYDTNGEKVEWREGFRLGWSRAAWRLFLINLVLILVILVVVLLLGVCSLLPIALSQAPDTSSGVFSVIPWIGFGLFILLIIFLVWLVVSLFMEFIRRVCVLEEGGVIDSIRGGIKLVRANFKDAFLLWLLLLAVQIVYGIAMFPVVLILLFFGLLMGGGGGVLLYLAVQAANSRLGIVSGILLGTMIFMTILIIPTIFLGGLKQVYLSNCWTLGYRQLQMKPVVGIIETKPTEELP